MSTDFTSGKNKEITSESTYLMLSNKLSELFKNNNINIDRDTLFEDFANEGLFNSTLIDKNTRWNLFTRYNSSNNYTSNKLDDVLILSKVNENDEFLNVLDETIETRKISINSLCSSYISSGLCNDITEKITGFFPHLDRPSEFLNIELTSGMIPCFEFGFTKAYAIITYEDSCGVNHLQPVPTYNDYTFNANENKIENDKFEFNTLYDEAPLSSSFSWNILTNSEDVMIKNNVTNQKIIEIATLSSAINDYITLTLEYEEII